MALITRLSRLFKADMHAVLDRLEEPDVLLKQAIREMEEAVACGARELETLEADRSRMQKRRDSIESSLAGIGAELDLCFEAGNEALARLLLRRRLQGERLGRHLAQQIERHDAGIGAQRERLAGQQRRLDELREKAAIFESAAPTADTGFGDEEFAVSEADVELALLRERQQRRAS